MNRNLVVTNPNIAQCTYFKRAMLERYELDALNALKRAATTEDETMRTYNMDEAITNVRLAMGLTGDV